VLSRIEKPVDMCNRKSGMALLEFCFLGIVNSPQRVGGNGLFNWTDYITINNYKKIST